MANARNRQILIFGATGGTGRELVRTALDRLYDIRVFVRDEARARHLLDGQSARLRFISGDAAVASDVSKAIESDLDAVVVSLGIYQSKPGQDDLTRATTNIIAAMQTSGIKRLVCISSLGVGDSRNQGNFVARMIQKTVLRNTLADKELQEAAIRASGLDWTIIRPSRLLNEAGPAFVHRWSGAQPSDKLVWAIGRASVAALALDCLDQPQTVHRAINVTGSATMQRSG